MSVRGIAGLPDNISLGLHRINSAGTGKQGRVGREENKKDKSGRKMSDTSHTISETDVNIGNTGMDMRRQLQISFGKLEEAEMSLQVDRIFKTFQSSDCCRSRCRRCPRNVISSYRKGSMT